MRWKCDTRGCFEETMRCHLGKLDHLLPGGNGMTDVDGYCHINGHKLFLEWKTGTSALAGSQRAAVIALSLDATVVVAWGDPVEMLPTAFEVYEGGVMLRRVVGEDVPVMFDVTVRQWGQRALEGALFQEAV